MKFPASVTGPGDPIVIPAGCDQVDWEAELAVVIGRPGRHIPAESAWAHVAGLCCAQDVSERRIQLSGGAGQFGLGKGFDSFCPLGPVLTTVDEVPDLDSLTLTCHLNGDLVQQARLGDLVTPVPAMIAALSRVTTLRAGDVLLCGSPGGVGLFLDPPRFLRPGDHLRTEITGLGVLTTTVVADLATTSHR